MRIKIIVTITQIISWVLFMLVDYVDEAFLSRFYLAVMAGIVLPVMVTVLYLIFENRIHDKAIARWANIVWIWCLWMMEDISLAALVIFLMEKDSWFIIQKYTGVGCIQEGWSNGMEYILFPVLNLLVPSLVVFIWNLKLYLKKIQVGKTSKDNKREAVNLLIPME